MKLYQVYFMAEYGQGFAIVVADSKEEAIKKADLKKDETVLTVEEL